MNWIKHGKITSIRPRTITDYICIRGRLKTQILCLSSVLCLSWQIFAQDTTSAKGQILSQNESTSAFHADETIHIKKLKPFYGETADLVNAYDTSPTEENKIKLRDKIATCLDGDIEKYEKQMESQRLNFEKLKQTLDQETTYLENIKKNKDVEINKMVDKLTGRKHLKASGNESDKAIPSLPPDINPSEKDKESK